MQIVSWGDNLHEMSKPVFSEKYHEFIICWISPETGKLDIAAPENAQFSSKVIDSFP